MAFAFATSGEHTLVYSCLFRMLISILFILIVSTGGFALTYWLEREQPMLWRVAAGTIIGQCIFSTLLFLLTFAAGLNVAMIIVAAALSVAPLLLLNYGDRRSRLTHDLAKAKGKLDGANLKKALPFVYYAGFVIFFVLFFDRAVMFNSDGIYTGGSNNLGDLPFHLGIIYSFTDGANFPPQNPSFAGAKLSYPFLSDLGTAAITKLGVGLREAMLVQNVSWAFALLVLLEGFVFRLVNDKLAARIAPILLFLSGGLGFLWFFSDYLGQSKNIFQLLMDIGKDYTITPEFRWGNSLITLFLTQRSFLLGMPLTLIVLGGLWKFFTSEQESPASRKELVDVVSVPLFFGLLAGILPLIHLHSLFVLFVVTGFLFVVKPSKWREWLAFGLGVSLVAIPELIWSMAGSASNATSFFEWHLGWDSGNTNVLWFWIKNTGLFIPILFFGTYLYLFPRPEKKPPEKSGKFKSKSKALNAEENTPVEHSLLLFYIPFLFLFVLANSAKLAPWEWDNIKVLIYWFIGSLPFVCLAIACLWKRSTAMRLLACLSIFALTAAGGLDVWRTVSRQHNYRVFEPDAVAIADRLRYATPPKSVFLNAPTYNTATVLTGRLSMMRYPGHLNSHGIDYRVREADVKYMYRGGPGTQDLFDKYGIKYVLISPEERNTLQPNEGFYSQFPVVAESGQYKVYRVAD